MSPPAGHARAAGGRESRAGGWLHEPPARGFTLTVAADHREHTAEKAHRHDGDAVEDERELRDVHPAAVSGHGFEASPLAMRISPSDEVASSDP